MLQQIFAYKGKVATPLMLVISYLSYAHKHVISGLAYWKEGITMVRGISYIDQRTDDPLLSSRVTEE